MARKLTAKERELFEAIREASNIALVQVSYAGEETAAIAVVNEDGGDYVVTPVALMVTDAMFARITDPTTD
jgi:hypothetical protein